MYLSCAQGHVPFYILKASYSPNCPLKRLLSFTFTPTARVLPFLLFVAQTRYYHEEKLLLSDGHNRFHCRVNLHGTDCQ